jgi:tRNA(fMet)-specific endonuclease VapC
METILLDTSILIAHRRSKNKSQTLLFELSGNFLLAVSSITIFELWRGDNSNEDDFWEKLFLNFLILNFDTNSAKIAGKDFLYLQKKGLPIGVEDVLIASIAKSNSMRLASNNLKHFERIPDLKIFTS